MSYLKPFKKQPSHLEAPLAVSPSAYTHGLEEIYALETVDLKTVRRLAEAPAQEESAVPTPRVTQEQSELPPQLELDLGDSLRGWMESFVMGEPIQILGLSSHAQKCLLDHGKNTLQDIIGINFRDFVYLKGMGQGHIDEVQQKLQKYLKGRSLHRCVVVDFSALFRSVAKSVDQKKLFCALSPYQLQDLAFLTTSEQMEVRRLDKETRDRWAKEVQMQLQSESAKLDFGAKWNRALEVYVKPWMSSRMGIACEVELRECLEKISYQPEIVAPLLKFLRSLYTRSYPFDFLHILDRDVYATDKQVVELYQKVLKKTESYFYQAGLDYPLEQLSMMLMKEFLRNWVSFPDGFIEKVLQTSPSLCLFKKEGVLYLCRA